MLEKTNENQYGLLAKFSIRENDFVNLLTTKLNQIRFEDESFIAENMDFITRDIETIKRITRKLESNGVIRLFQNKHFLERYNKFSNVETEFLYLSLFPFLIDMKTGQKDVSFDFVDLIKLEPKHSTLRNLLKNSITNNGLLKIIKLGYNCDVEEASFLMEKTIGTNHNKSYLKFTNIVKLINNSKNIDEIINNTNFLKNYFKGLEYSMLNKNYNVFSLLDLRDMVEFNLKIKHKFNFSDKGLMRILKPGEEVLFRDLSAEDNEKARVAVLESILPINSNNLILDNFVAKNKKYKKHLAIVTIIERFKLEESINSIGSERDDISKQRKLKLKI